MSLDIFTSKTVSDTEKLIKQLDLTAPRITSEHIDNNIKNVYFHLVPGSNTTLCVLTLQNNYTVVGHSACASPENFNEKLGRTVAYGKAKDQIGHLEGYLLCEALANDSNSSS